MRGVFLIAFVLIYQFIFSDPVLALTLTFDQAPDSVDSDAEFEVNVSLSCSGCKDSYLRAVFFQDGTTNYFGYTQNEKGDWVNSTADKTLYYHLAPDALVEGSWSGKLKAKADLLSDYFGGSGSYQFKVGRYTSANSSATWSSNQATIQINTPTPSPSPVPTATPTAVPTLSPTPSVPPPYQGGGQVGVKTATHTLTPPPTKTVSPPSKVEGGREGVSDVLIASLSATPSIEDESTPSASPSGQVASATTTDDHPVDSFTISAIVITLASLSLFLFRRLRFILKAKALQ